MKPGPKTFTKPYTGITYTNAELKDFIDIAVVRSRTAEMAKAKVLLTPTTTLHVSYTVCARSHVATDLTHCIAVARR